MKLALSEDQTILQDTLARLFREESTPGRVRAAESTGFDPALWAQLVEMGLIPMRAPEDRGGGGLSLLDALLAATESGRHVAAVPVAEAITASALLLRLDTPEPLRQRLAQGAVATLALAPVVEGQVQVVPAAAVADIIVMREGERVVALTRPTPAAKAPNSADSALAILDLSAAGAGERFVIGQGPAAADAHAAAVEEWKLLTAASLAGLAQRALELAAAYSVERVQFNKSIGAFQGIAHPLADSATEVDGANLLAWQAAWAIAEGRPDAGAAVAMAYWWAGQAAERATQRALRTFGGYGLSLEYDVQLYFRRAKLSALLAGDPAQLLDQVAARLWDDAPVPLPDAGDIGIDFGFGAKAEAYAAELRAFVEANMTPDVVKKKHHSTSGHHAGFHKKLAEAGHLFPDMAVGGQPGRDRYEVMAAAPLWEDLNWTRTPIAVTEFVAKMTEMWSTPEAKAEIMPRFISGDALGCLGFSEPASGSDVFAAKLGAVRDGDDWVVNGQKMFTTNAHNADYILLLARTDNSGKKHQGLTMFVCPLNVPGVDIHPVYTLQDERTNIVYFGDVRVPDRYRLGEIGDGARVMASALGIEHGGAGYHAAQTAMMKHAVAWARKPRNGVAPLADPALRRILARAAVNDAVAEVLCRRQIWAEAQGVHNPAYGPMAKLFTTETMYADGQAIVAAAAPWSLVRGLDHDLDMVEVTMRRALGMTVYGGTSEIHRSLIAEKTLGMPNSRS